MSMHVQLAEMELLKADKRCWELLEIMTTVAINRVIPKEVLSEATVLINRHKELIKIMHGGK